MNEAAKVIKDFVDKKINENPNYSLRAIARDLKISHSYLSQIINGKKKIPASRIDVFAKVLDIDEFYIEEIKKTIALESGLSLSQSSTSNAFSELEVVHDKNLRLLEKWYYSPILNLVTCDNFQNDPIWISKKLGVPAADVKSAISFLKLTGFLKEVDGQLVKSYEKSRTPTVKSKEKVREFHEMMIKKSISHLRSKTTDGHFNKRLISGLTFASNPKSLEKAKIKLNEAIHEVASLLAEGPCTEVYQLNVQLFPHTEDS